MRRSSTALKPRLRASARCQPELRGLIISVHVNVRRLIHVVAYEVDPIRAAPQNGRHSSLNSPAHGAEPANARFSRRRSRSAESESWAAAAASLATHPVGRTPLEIHDRQNPNAAWLDLVEESVGKSAEKATTNGTTENHPRFGMVLNRP